MRSYLIVLRDVVILVALTFVIGVVVAAATNDPERRVVASTIGNFGVLVFGFAVAAGMASEKRIMHVTIVATTLWLLNFLLVAVGTNSFIGWLLNGVFTAVVAGLGLGLSYLFVRRSASTSAEPSAPSRSQLCVLANEALLKKEYAEAVRLFILAERESALTEAEARFKSMAERRLQEIRRKGANVEHGKT